MLSLNKSEFKNPSPAIQLIVKDETDFMVLSITLTSLPDNGVSPTIFFDCTSTFCNGKCYSATVEKQANGEYLAILKEV